MKLSRVCFWLGTCLLTTARLVPLFPYEESVLESSTLQKLPHDVARLFTFQDNNSSTANLTSSYECKVFPGDKDWPSDDKWDHFRRITGSLIAAAPASSVCYNNGTSLASQPACDALTAGWSDVFAHLDDPIEMFSGLYEGLTCQPPAIHNSGICTQGGYPVYTVNVSRVDQIQLAVNFARNAGFRLVIKNTGHDFNGKSGGAGSLSVWLHYLKDTIYLPDYKDANYSGPAIKAGAGVQAFELYAAAHDVGMVAVGGECATVGVMGGYIQGGGHSPMGSMFGMAADQALGFELVTANGEFVTANAEENSDLFWALRGGGGGTFGVVTSVIVKVYPDMPVTTTSILYTTANNSVSSDAFWAGARAYFSHFQEYADAGMYSYFFLWAEVPGELSFWVRPFFAPNKTVAETAALLDPLFDELAAIGIAAEHEMLHFDSFKEAWSTSFTPEGLVPPIVASASRLWPRQNWNNDTILNATFDAIRFNVENGRHSAWGFQIAPTTAKGGYQNTAVNPAWRETAAHVMSSVVWSDNATASEILDIRREFQDVYMQGWRDLSVGAGSYLNEADRLEPNFQHAFYGSNYPDLLAVKQRHDPWNVFWAVTAVGSEVYEVQSIDGLPNENGRLCRAAHPSVYFPE